ncbi:hypothetical protein ACFLTZ_06965, partial [Chloroflexota bacterium]
ESSKIRQIGGENSIYKHLRHDLDMPFVKAIALPESCAAAGMCIVQVKRTTSTDVWRALEALKECGARWVVAVNDDINPWDLDAVAWAISTRVLPHRDVRAVKHDVAHVQEYQTVQPGRPIHDPSLSLTDLPESSRLLIDATIFWDYPPISLPGREFMEEAIKLWEEEKLPALKLKEPWYGYSLGFWSEEEQEEAKLAVKGEYYATGEKLARRRKSI